MDELEKARLNRERVAAKSNIDGYLKVELYLQTHPSILPLPDWIPTDNIPYISLRDIDENLRQEKGRDIIEV